MNAEVLAFVLYFLLMLAIGVVFFFKEKSAGELKVLIPDANMGDVIGDLNKRRGRVMGMNPDPENPGYQTVEAEVPMGEMSSYTIDLRAMSQGRGSYTLKFVRYEEVPQMNQAKIIEDAKKDEEEA